MKPLLRASVVAVFALASLEGHAAVRRPCVTTLEARPGSVAPDVTTAPPKKPCLVVIAYTPPQRNASVRRDARDHGRAAVFASTPSGARA